MLKENVLPAITAAVIAAVPIIIANIIKRLSESDKKMGELIKSILSLVEKKPDTGPQDRLSEQNNKIIEQDNQLLVKCDALLDIVSLGYTNSSLKEDIKNKVLAIKLKAANGADVPFIESLTTELKSIKDELKSVKDKQAVKVVEASVKEDKPIVRIRG